MPTASIFDATGNQVFDSLSMREGLRKHQDSKTLSLLTGMMGSGKSTLGRCLLQSGGVVLIDADKVAKQRVYEIGLKENTPKLREIFGGEIFVCDVSGEVLSVNLREVAALFFGRPQLQAKFALAFDAQILQAVKQMVNTAYADGARHVIVENAVAIEKGWHNQFEWNHVICTICSEDRQLARLMKRPGMSEEQHRARIDAQFSSYTKMSYADILVVTNGQAEDLSTCIEEILEILNMD